MPTVTLNAWVFDPAFQFGEVQQGSDWDFVDNGDTVQEFGSPVDLTSSISEVTLNDANDNNVLVGGTGDQFLLDGVTYDISQVYNGDYAYINDEWVLMVTFYGADSGGNSTAVSLPIVDGNISSAFPGSVSATEWITTPNDIELPFDEIPCFTRGTLIQTPQGPVPVEQLQVGDKVVTRDNGPQAIMWIGSSPVSARTLERLPRLRPIRIQQGAFGEGAPSQDLMVSPQHRVLVRSRIARRMFGTDEVLVAAKHLVTLPGIDCAEDVEEVEYLHFLLRKHEIVESNGAWTETLYTGQQALKAVGAEAHAEIFTLFPELRDMSEEPVGARQLVPGRQSRALARRHARNNRTLIEAI